MRVSKILKDGFRYDDFAVIFTLLIVNAVVGFWQERQADNAIEFLKKVLPLACTLFESY
jgi:magnesium-transporting ATPase (P-type)